MDNITIPDFDELQFDDDKHIYKLNGIEIPSVTTIMKPLSNAEYNGISENTLRKAAEKGTAVHAAEMWAKFKIEDRPSQTSCGIHRCFRGGRLQLRRAGRLSRLKNP